MQASFKNGEVLEKIRNTNETIIDKTDKSEKAILKLNNEILRFNDVEKSIRENSSKIEVNSNNIADFQYNSNTKFSDFDARILTILDSLHDLSMQLEKKGNGVGMGGSNSLGHVGQNSSEHSNAQIVSEISKTNKEVDHIKKLFREFSEKIDKISKANISIEEQVKELVAKSDNNIIINNNNNNNSKKMQQKNSSSDVNGNINNGNGKPTEGLESESTDNKNFNDDDPNLIEPDLRSNSNSSLRKNIEMLFEQIKKSQESHRSLTANLGQKAEKSEYEKLMRSISSEIEKLNKRISELSSNTDKQLKSIKTSSKNNITLGDDEEQLNSENENKNKNKSSSNKANHKAEIAKKASNSPSKHKSSINNNNKNYENNNISAALSNGSDFEFDEGIISMTRSLIERELNSKEEFTKMLEFMQEQKECSQICKADLDRLFTSVVEIRSALSSQKLEELHGKIGEVDFALRKQKNLFEERFKNLEGEAIATDDVNNAEQPNGGGSIKDNFRSINASVKTVCDKIEKVTMRLDNMNTEILTKVKKDLSAESAKILVEFKSDLKNSIMSIQEQLREKVDKFSLDEFGKYVNEKLSLEMNKKLDRTDLKKNNNLINKKIDTLENKISKTLVDTLIDLQMEEAPLISKKSLGGGSANEKCASCNQFVLNTTFINEDNLNETLHKNHNNNNNNNNSVNPSKIKFKSVQESCYKFGAGSYSRYLNNFDNVNEQLRITKQNVHLPEIASNNKTSKKLNLVNFNTVSSESKLKNKILGEITEKNYLNTMLNEELEKKIVNPDNLLKTANKLFESVEKEKRAIISNNFSNK